MSDSKNKKPLSGDQGYSKGGRFLSALCSIIGTLMILAVIAFMIPVAVPGFLGYNIYEVISGSMEPEIPVGSIVYVKAAEPESIEAGEIIAFTGGGSVVVHRVVENNTQTRSYVTKGDANAMEDINEVPYTALMGRVTKHLPVLGHVFRLYTSSSGKIYLLVFALFGGLLSVLGAKLKG